MKILAAGKTMVLALALAASGGAQAAPAPTVAQEVNHLLGYIAKSGCDFYRNGSWADATLAEAHVRTKFDYLARHEEIASVTDFIEKAASKSSITGLPYQVKCPGTSPVLTRAWLSEELARYQARR